MSDQSPKKPNKVTQRVSPNGLEIEIDIVVNDPLGEITPELRRVLDERKRKRREEREARQRAAGTPTPSSTNASPDGKPAA